MEEGRLRGMAWGRTGHRRRDVGVDDHVHDNVDLRHLREEITPGPQKYAAWRCMEVHGGAWRCKEMVPPRTCSWLQELT